MTPAETAAWDAEIDAREGRVHPFAAMFGQPVDELTRIFEKVTAAIRAPRHARPYSRLRERDIFDEAYTPRHAKRSHRAEVAA